LGFTVLTDEKERTMFNSTILDVAIGMIFVYLLLSLMCSAANEVIELWLKNRAADLERGIRELFNDRDRATGLVQKIYAHPLVSSLFEKPYDPKRLSWIGRLFGRVNLPSYIPARNFALALMDTKFEPREGAPRAEAQIPPDASGVAGATPPTSPSPQMIINVAPAAPPPPPDENALAALRANIQSIPNENVRKALTALVAAAGNDPAKIRENIENWFNSSMDRVSGWYKRRAQIFVLIIAFFVAVAVNADSIVIAKRLWNDRPLRDSLVAAADAYAKANAPVASPTPTPAPAPASSAPGGPSQPKVSASTTPTPTPTPTPKPTPMPTPTPCAPPVCEGKNSDGTDNKDSEQCRKALIKCQRDRDCSADECPLGKEDSPQCKLKKNQCEISNLGLPIGWVDEEWPGLHFWQPREFVTRWEPSFRLHFFGWLLTALAISLGAPFWFDMLNKLIVVRSTVKPKEKSPDEKSKD
jgi:hypothetical protein